MLLFRAGLRSVLCDGFMSTLESYYRDKCGLDATEPRLPIEYYLRLLCGDDPDDLPRAPYGEYLSKMSGVVYDRGLPEEHYWMLLVGESPGQVYPRVGLEGYLKNFQSPKQGLFRFRVSAQGDLEVYGSGDPPVPDGTFGISSGFLTYDDVKLAETAVSGLSYADGLVYGNIA